MAWISDVVPYSTILSTWGNSIRNLVVFNFTSQAERDSHNATLTDGSVCYTADTQTLWTKRGGAWYPISPVVVTGTTYQVTTPASGETAVAVVTSPVGFRRGVVTYSGRSNTNTWAAATWIDLDIALYQNGTQVFRTQESVPGNIPNIRLHHTISVPVTVTPGAAQTLQFNVSMANPTAQSRTFFNDGSQAAYGIFVP